jgi:hypothetical protein
MCHKETPCIALKQARISFFHFLFFSYTKLGNKKAEQILPGGAGTSGRGKEMGKGHRRVNMV